MLNLSTRRIRLIHATTSSRCLVTVAGNSTLSLPRAAMAAASAISPVATFEADSSHLPVTVPILSAIGAIALAHTGRIPKDQRCVCG
jgi:hypothetical protein